MKESFKNDTCAGKKTFRLSNRRIVFLSLAILLAALFCYLLAAHYVKAYSDAHGWLIYAQRMLRGVPTTKRAFGYSVFLAAALKLVGPFKVFLANLPLLVLLPWLIYLITVQSVAREENPSHHARMTGLLAACILVGFNSNMFLYLVNPYREALAFCLLLAGMAVLFSFFNHRGFWKVILSALLMGLSISARETCGLFLPVAFGFFLYKFFTQRDTYWLKGAFGFSLFFILGLVPFFVQNYLHAGHWWLPAYATLRMGSHQAVRIPDDFPVPGMGYRYFIPVGKLILIKLFAEYTWIGAAALAAGVFMGIRKRLELVTHLLLPFAIFNILFYSFYRVPVQRYLFVVDIAIAPIMAVGFYESTQGAFSFLKNRFTRLPGALPRWTMLLLGPLMTTVIVVMLSYSCLEQAPATKVWHLKTIERFLSEKIQRPAVFVGNKHRCQAISWILQESRDGINIDGVNQTILESGLAGLALIREEWMKKITEQNYYLVDSRPHPLLKNYFDLIPVLSLKKSPVPLIIYGRPVRQKIFSVKPWSRKEIVLTREVVGKSDSHVLQLDCYQIWDDPARTFCRLLVNGRIVEERVPSGLHFVQLEGHREDGAIEDIRIVSDAPLPADPVAVIRPMNTEISLPLGAGSESWHFPLLSDSLISHRPFKEDSCILFDQGSILLPTHADKDHSVLGVFHLEFVQRSRRAAQQYSITLSAAGSEITRPLPPPRTSMDITIRLGNGAGHLQMIPVDIRTTLPAQDVQAEQNYSPGFVKIYNTRVISIPNSESDGLTIDVGSKEDAAYIADGFYGRARSDIVPNVRWTMDSARMRIPMQQPGHAMEVAVKTIRCRPADDQAEPRFFFNDVLVGNADLTTLRQGDIETYVFPLETGQFRDNGNNILTIHTGTWNPSKALDSADNRELGIMIDSVIIQPVRD